MYTIVAVVNSCPTSGESYVGMYLVRQVEMSRDESCGVRFFSMSL